MAFGRQEPLVGENAAARSRSAELLQEYAALKAEANQVTENVTKGVGDKQANVDAFQDVSARLRRNAEAITGLKNEVYADEKIFDSKLARELQETMKATATFQSSFEPTGARAANAVKNEQGNDPSTGSTEGDTTTTDGDNRVGTGASGFNGPDDRGTDVGKTNAQDGSGSGDNKDARLNSVGLAAGGVPKNMADLNRSTGVSIRTGFGEGAAAFVSTTFGASTTGASTFATGAALPSGRAAAVSIKQTTCPTFTTSPSSAFNVIIPLCSAGNSNVALSESTSAIA